MSNPRTANGYARKQLRKWLAAQERPCWICAAFGRPAAIDYTLPAKHPGAFEVDELVPVSLGGDPLDPLNVDAAHRRCNQWRGNKSVREVLEIARQGKQPEAPTASPETQGSSSLGWI